MAYCACMIILIALAVCVYKAFVRHSLVNGRAVAEGLASVITHVLFDMVRKAACMG